MCLDVRRFDVSILLDGYSLLLLLSVEVSKGPTDVMTDVIALFENIRKDQRIMTSLQQKHSLQIIDCSLNIQPQILPIQCSCQRCKSVMLTHGSES